jgi:hypothetical protein
MSAPSPAIGIQSAQNGSQASIPNKKLVSAQTLWAQNQANGQQPAKGQQNTSSKARKPWLQSWKQPKQPLATSKAHLDALVWLFADASTDRSDRFDHVKSDHVSGAHLAAAGPYRDAIANLENKNKNLVHRDWKVPANRRNVKAPCRIKLLMYDETGKPTNNGKPRDFQDATEFKNFMANIPANTPSRRLYLLEGVGPDYIATIGEHLNIDPAFFLRHQRTALWEGRHKAGNTAKLASAEHPWSNFFMEYAELLYFVDIPNSRSLRNPNDNRHINMSKMPIYAADLDRVGIMHRKASFWSESFTGGWNALILIDPGLPRKVEAGITKTDILVGSSKHADPVPLETDLYQGGYLDFIPYTTAAQEKTSCAPPRNCMLEDMCHYWEKHHTMVSGHIKDSSLFATIFLQKIIASNYMILIGYLEANVNELETAILLHEVKENKKHQTMHVTEQWSILQSWSHRFPEYGGMVEEIIDWHEEAAENLNATGKAEWAKLTKDFKAIKRQLDILRDRTQLLSDSFVGLASMAGIQESLDEAKAVKILTVLGFFFVPMSLVSSLFAMPNKDTLIHVPDKGVLGGFRYYALIAFTVSGGMTFFVVCYIWGLDALRRSVASAVRFKRK